MRRVRTVMRREYLENLRTKTFWIGILTFPVLLALGILIPSWLSKKVDVRRFAVLDRTKDEWLLKAVMDRADLPDLYKCLDIMKKALETGKEDLELFPEALRIRLVKDFLAQLNEEKLRKLADEMLRLQGPEGRDLVEKVPSFLLSAADKEKLLEEILPRIPETLRMWWRGLPPKEAERFAGSSERGRYRFVPLAELGNPDEEGLRRLVDREALFAFFVIGPDPVGKPPAETEPPGKAKPPAEAKPEEFKYVAKNLTDTGLWKWFQGLATEVVREKRVAQANLTAGKARWLAAPLAFKNMSVAAGGGEAEASARAKVLQLAPAAFVYILWISIFVVAQLLLTSTIEEKSNRVMEVLLSSVSPLELLIGKMAGVAATGLTMVGSWAVFFFLAVKLLPFVVEIPDLGLDALLANPAYLGSFLAYFLLGYLLYAALLVGLGSVCNTLKEAQNLMQPIVLVLIVPLLAMIPIVQDPNGSLARVLSFIPPFTPFVMMNRVAGPPALWEYVATSALLLATVVLACWASAKIFRVGILMTGKPPRLREILGWLKAPVGYVPTRREESAAAAGASSPGDIFEDTRRRPSR